MKENLMFGCLGNGITVCDRNRMYLGDYATVAHISGEGLVRIYCQFLSEEALDSIHSMARKETEKHSSAGRAGAKVAGSRLWNGSYTIYRSWSCSRSMTFSI